MSSLAGLPILRPYRSKRASSFDTAGNNSDYWYFPLEEVKTIFQTDKPGCIKHIWMTVGGGGPHHLCRIRLRVWWDGESEPSIDVPLGDFFGIGFGIFKNFISLPLQMSPQDGRGMNCWWPMPYNAARIEIINECTEPFNLYYYVDFEEYGDTVGPEVGRFHAWWNRENPTEGWLNEKLNNDNLWEVWGRQPNLDGAKNYTILETTGSGVYVGCNYNVDVFERQGNDWYGEGDDMIFIDGEVWPPSLHGTGTEDYFNMAFCPQTEYCAPYHGLTLYSGNSDWPWKGKNCMYRYHIEDPIRFHESIRVTIEHGHANKLSNDTSSTAYWYQTEPHGKLPALLPAEMRIPRPNELPFSPKP